MQSDGKYRVGMGIHSGRAYKPFLGRKTFGCIRTTPEAMLFIDLTIKEHGPLTNITVQNNKSVSPNPMIIPISIIPTVPVVPVNPSTGPGPLIIPQTPTPKQTPLPIIITPKTIDG